MMLFDFSNDFFLQNYGSFLKVKKNTLCKIIPPPIIPHFIVRKFSHQRWKAELASFSMVDSEFAKLASPFVILRKLWSIFLLNLRTLIMTSRVLYNSRSILLLTIFYVIHESVSGVFLTAN